MTVDKVLGYIVIGIEPLAESYSGDIYTNLDEAQVYFDSYSEENRHYLRIAKLVQVETKR